MPVMSVDGCGVGGRFGRGMIGVERRSLTGRLQDASRGIGSSESGCEGGQGDKNNVWRASSLSGGCRVGSFVSQLEQARPRGVLPPRDWLAR